MLGEAVAWHQAVTNVSYPLRPHRLKLAQAHMKYTSAQPDSCFAIKRKKEIEEMRELMLRCSRRTNREVVVVVVSYPWLGQNRNFDLTEWLVCFNCEAPDASSSSSTDLLWCQHYLCILVILKQISKPIVNCDCPETYSTDCRDTEASNTGFWCVLNLFFFFSLFFSTFFLSLFIPLLSGVYVMSVHNERFLIFYFLA